MNHSVVIKANNFGIMVVLDKELEYEQLKQQVAKKFKESAKFLGDAQMALSFEGRELSEQQQREMLNVISENSDLRIVCVIDKDQEKEQLFQKTLQEKLMEMDSKTGQFFKGNLRNGQVLEFETSVIILGDVNPGAKIISKGNIIIIGALKGTAVAGVSGNENAFILALTMNPTQIRIGDIIARSPDSQEKEITKEPQIAFVEDGNIYIENLNKSVLNDIKIY